MMEMLNKLSDFIDILIKAIGIWGPLLGCILIILESIIPILPLFAFITLNFITFGKVLGFLISWICTIIGCSLSFWIFDKGVKGWFKKHLRNKKPVESIMKIIDDIKFEKLVVLLAIPFTPAFAVNIAAGLSDMSFKKYLKALIIGKLFLVYFWGFVGTSLLQSLTHPMEMAKVIGIVIVAYLVSKILNKKLNLD